MNPESSEQRAKLEQLLELHYGLLDPDDAASLQREIDSDPKVASLWQKTIQTAAQIGEAAKIVQSLDLDRSLIDREDVSPDQGAAVHNVSKDAETHSERVDTSSRRPLWISYLSIASAACIGFLVIGFAHLRRMPDPPLRSIALTAHVVPQNDSKWVNASVVVTTSRVEPGGNLGGNSGSIAQFSLVPASISFAVLNRGAILFQGTANSDQNGRAQIELPDDLIVPQGSSLELMAGELKEDNPAIVRSPYSLSVPLPPTSCLTYLSTDRSVYLAGEPVFFRSVTLTRKRGVANLILPVKYELQNADGARVIDRGPQGLTHLGVGNGRFYLPSDLSPGEYVMVAKSLDGVFPDERVSFQVKGTRQVQVRKDLVFDQKVFSVGQTVRATLKLSDENDHPVANQDVSALVFLNGKMSRRINSRTGDSGTLKLSFLLAEVPAECEAWVVIETETQAGTESEPFRIPLSSGTYQVNFYPESGDLIAGLVNRVYGVIQDQDQLPIRVRGELIDEQGHVLEEVTSNRDGRFLFEVTPRRDHPLRFRIVDPKGKKGQGDGYLLPSAQAQGVVLRTGNGVFGVGEPIGVELQATQPSDVLVRAVSHGRLVSEATASLDRTAKNLQLELPDSASGVIRVTVFDRSVSPPKPLAERLVFRRVKKKLSVSAHMESESGVTSLEVQVADEQGNSHQSVLGISVVDEAFVGDAKRSMDSHFYLASEVEHPHALENATFFLQDSRESQTQLDLLLGTQGWRRFVSFMDPEREHFESNNFRERLVRLLSLEGGGGGEADSATTTPIVERSWLAYQRHRSRVMYQTLGALVGWLILVSLIGIGLLTRHHAKWRKMGWGASLLFCLAVSTVGCGRAENRNVFSASASFEGEKDDKKEQPTKEITEKKPTPQTSISTERWKQEAELLEVLRTLLVAQDPGNEVLHRPITPDDLRAIMVSRGLGAEAMADQWIQQLQFPVRQYAVLEESIKSPPLGQPQRVPTLFWHPLLVTDAEGFARLQFPHPNGSAKYRITIDAHDSDGRMGGWISTQTFSEERPE